jgi:hypothetical protein
MRLIKCHFTFETAWGSKEKTEFILSPTELSKEEILKLLKNTQPYTECGTRISNLLIIPQLTLSKPYVL